jgi:hypothetical protein
MSKHSTLISLPTCARMAPVCAVLLILLLAAGCGVGGRGIQPVTPSSVSVTVTPANPSVNLVSTQQFTATVSGNSSQSVTWSLSGTGCTGADCGTIDQNGLYTAPWCAASPAVVTITARSVADPSAVGFTTAKHVVPGAGLSGQFAFLFHGIDADGLMQAAGTFIADGKGNITNGLEDVVRMSAVNNNVTFTGTYNLPCYHRGTITFTDSLSRTQTFAFGMDDAGNSARFIELDSTGVRGSGLVLRQDPAAFATAQITGDFAFGYAGSEAPVNLLGRVGVIGQFHADGLGAITSGAVDVNTDGVSTANSPLTGAYSVAPTTGRGTAIFTAAAPLSKTYNLAFYVVSATEAFWVSIDPPGPAKSLFGGQSFKQSGGPFTLASLNSASVFSLTGKAPGIQNSDVLMGVITPDGLGGIAGGPADENFDTALSSYAAMTGGTYTVGGNGRGTLHLDIAPGVFRDLTFYMVSPNQAFLLDGNGSAAGPRVGVGFVEQQTGAPFTTASLQGTYYMGTLALPTRYIPVQCGAVILDGLGNARGMGDASDIFGNHANVGMLGTNFALAPSGRGVASTIVFYTISPGKALMFEMDNTQHQPVVTYIEK